MHTCLSLSNVDCQSRVEEAVSHLADRLNALCDSIDSCHISVEQPVAESGERCWRIALSLRIFDESVRARTSRPTGPDAALSLCGVLDEIYERATEEMTRIAKSHHCCCIGPVRSIAPETEECA